MNKGFTLIETILSLIVVSTCVVLLSMILQVALKRDYVLHSADDEKNIHQLRLLFVLSKDYEIYGDMLYFRYLDKDMNFYFKDRKLILEEGYQVFFNDLDAVDFKQKNGCYYIEYTRKKEIRKRVIGCE